ncbi:MAG: alpha-ketoglutarate-dependent dioxygenase AlkB [Chitinophagales bacterium]
MNTLFETIRLNTNYLVFTSEKPVSNFVLDDATFLKIWDLHPEEYHIVKIHGKEIPTPRWQQAYGKNYRYTGSKNNALPIPDILKVFLEWSQENIDERLNGLLLNWYDGLKNHYIGAHRDSTKDLQEGSPIVTISLGEERVFRMRPYKNKGFKDIEIRNGNVIVVPWNTNQHWTHEVPHFKKYSGKRISITLRAYSE